MKIFTIPTSETRKKFLLKTLHLTNIIKDDGCRESLVFNTFFSFITKIFFNQLVKLSLRDKFLEKVPQPVNKLKLTKLKGKYVIQLLFFLSLVD